MNFAGLPMTWNVALFVASAAVVWFAGSRLARYADAIAERTGLGREFLGMILLGGVTSLPELAVATTATLQGAPILSINDVLGSAAINIVILAVADAIVGRDALTSMQSSPGVMLQGVVSLVLMAMVAAAIVTGDRSVLGIGIWSWLMLAFYVFAVRLVSKSYADRAWRVVKQRATDTTQTGQHDEVGVGVLAWKTAATAGVILVGGFLLARSGQSLAEQTGLGVSFFGAVFLGFATSLPEVSTVIAAVKLRRYEMAIADVFGTNLFNVTIIVLVDVLYRDDAVLTQAGNFGAFAALLSLGLTAFYLLGMLERRDKTFLRMGFDSIAVVLAYVAALVVLHGLR